MSPVTDLVADLDIELDRLWEAQDAREQRRALRATLATLYELRCYREDHTPPTKLAYYNRAAACPDGHVTEGILLLRGALIHDVTKPYSPQTKTVYLGSTTFPGKYTYPQTNLLWRTEDEIKQHLRPDVLSDICYPSYVSQVAGQPVLTTLKIARDFLVSDPHLPPL